MPRKPRFYLPDLPVHIVQRGNNRQPVFFSDADRRTYLKLLDEGARSNGCAIHAYVLMTNHVHLLATPSTKVAVSRMMQQLGRTYVMYFNRRYGRTGTLWEGRHKASVVSAEDYFLACSRYIEMNPVRAGMVDGPEMYTWSSYRGNAKGEDNPVLTPHEVYIRLGGDEPARRQAYTALFAESPAVAEDNRAIRESTQTGTPLGSTRFKQEIEVSLRVKVGYRTRGRPRNTPAVPT